MISSWKMKKAKKKSLKSNKKNFQGYEMFTKSEKFVDWRKIAQGETYTGTLNRTIRLNLPDLRMKIPSDIVGKVPGMTHEKGSFV